jgi:threonine/homoserine/homoserine lactone efflux protein
MPPGAEITPVFGNVSYWIHLPILVVVISLVYAGTRYDDWPNILREARRWLVRLFGFLFVVVLVLYILAVVTP